MLGRKGGEPETGDEDEMPSKSLPCDVMVVAILARRCTLTTISNVTSRLRQTDAGYLLLFAPTLSPGRWFVKYVPTTVAFMT